ncbi:hypothetical protein ACR6HW_01310 [Fusibacter sp. JL298sf-3]
MKVVNKSIEVISWFDADGQITPIRFRIFETASEGQVLKISKIVERSFEKLAGNAMWVYKCLCYDGAYEKVFVLKYELATCRWILFKC